MWEKVAFAMFTVSHWTVWEHLGSVTNLRISASKFVAATGSEAWYSLPNVGKTIINYPLGNGNYTTYECGEIWWMVCGFFNPHELLSVCHLQFGMPYIQCIQDFHDPSPLAHAIRSRRPRLSRLSRRVCPRRASLPRIYTNIVLNIVFNLKKNITLQKLNR